MLSRHCGVLLLQEFVQQLQVAPTLHEQLPIKMNSCPSRGGKGVMRRAKRCWGWSITWCSGATACATWKSCAVRDLEVLRGAVGTQQLLGVNAIFAPPTAGEFRRKWDIGDIHDLARVKRLLQERVRPLQGAVKAVKAVKAVNGSVTMELDSRI